VNVLCLSIHVHLIAEWVLEATEKQQTDPQRALSTGGRAAILRMIARNIVARPP
jgi:hypothetical protein